jgi:hypothetical protein
VLLKSPIATQTSAKQQNILTKLVLQPLHKTTTASNFAAELHHQIRTTYLLTDHVLQPHNIKLVFFPFPFSWVFFFHLKACLLLLNFSGVCLQQQKHEPEQQRET